MKEKTMATDETTGPPTEPLRHKGTFAEGESNPGQYPDELEVGSFAEGEETQPDAAEKEHRGTFAEGESHPELHPKELHVGRFGESDAP
jgi:hypothetical protein